MKAPSAPPLRHIFKVMPLAVLAQAVFALAVVYLSLPQQASADEVECDSIRLKLTDASYDFTCETDNGADITFESLEANSADGSHFLVIGDLKTNFRYIFPGGSSLRKNLTDAFGSLDVEDWHSGKNLGALTTSEFTSDYKTIPSACVGFQGYFGHEQGGWRRHIIGFGCSRVGDRAQVYDALNHVNFPK